MNRTQVPRVIQKDAFEQSCVAGEVYSLHWGSRKNGTCFLSWS
jgi:hypothetical protein